MKKYLFPAALMLSSGLAVVGSAQAMTSATTLNVSATIQADCVANTTAVNFGNVISGNGAVASGNIAVTCTLSTPYTVALDAGGNFVATRRITDGANFLDYTLTDPLSAALWGDGGTTIADAVVSGTGTGAVQNYGVDASMTGAGVPAGVYSDIVNVTVTY